MFDNKTLRVNPGVKVNSIEITISDPSEAKTIEPLGLYVLVQMETIEDKSAGGILLGDVKREQGACDIGTVIAIGPTAFRGFAGCNPSDYPPSHPFYSKEPHEIWGINVGDKVEYRSFEGKLSGVKDVKNMRYIPDTQIIGKVN